MPQEQDKVTARDPNETEINNMCGREFKAIVIKICIRLEKRVVDLIEFLNKEKTF